MKVMGPTAGRLSGAFKLTPGEHADFWSRARIKGAHQCWVWCGGNYGRYGSFQFRGKTSLAHRIAIFATGGEIPDGWCVCHKCDNAKCVNPAHLFVATQKDNMWDMIRKGRGRHGGRRIEIEEAA